MPQEIGYQSQVSPPAPAAPVQASPDAFGAGFGQGVAELGGSIHEASLRAYQIQRQQQADSQASDAAVKLAAVRQAADRWSIDARNNAAPGGAGHAEAAANWLQTQTAGLIDGITDDRVRRSIQEQVADFGSRFTASEYQWQEGARIGKFGADQLQVMNADAARAYANHDEAAFGEGIRAYAQTMAAMTGIPETVKAKLIAEHDRQVSTGFLNGVKDTNPAAVAALLDSGHFNAVLTPEQMEHLRTAATAEIHRREAAVKADNAHQLTLQRESLATQRATLDTGAGSPQDWGALATGYDKIGDTSSAVTARAKGTEMAATLVHRGDTLPQMDATIAGLQDKQRTGSLTAAEASTLSGLNTLRQQTAARLGQSGGALLQLQYATGKPIAALNIADPASFAARGAQARAAAQTYGRVAIEPILDTELPAFKDLYAAGTNGKLQVLDRLRAFNDPRTAAGAAAQIAGNDDGQFRIAAQLGHDVARDVLRGDETLKGAPQVWDQKRATHDFAAWYGKVLSQVGGSYRDDVFQSARAFYAQRGAEGGETAYNPGRFAEAVETVLGRAARNGQVTGGIAHYPGALAIVPQDVAPDNFQRSFARANAHEYAAAAGNGAVPVWPDGHPMTENEIRRQVPTLMGDGRYGFRDGQGGFIHGSKGGAYTVDFGKLPRR